MPKLPAAKYTEQQLLEYIKRFDEEIARLEEEMEKAETDDEKQSLNALKQVQETSLAFTKQDLDNLRKSKKLGGTRQRRCGTKRRRRVTQRKRRS
jgi:NADH:ubiquinone oxidoreductase subunit E